MEPEVAVAPVTLGPYELDAPLGQGGMGSVYAAWHRRWGHPVAVKVLRGRPSAPSVEAFRREVRAVAALDHPGIVTVEDHGVVPAGVEALAEGAPWLAMERAEGPVGPGDWASVRAVLEELLQALAAAHAHGILHLDVKASNVLRRGDGSVALADFGIALLRDGGSQQGSTSWGSPPYMAPERFDQRPERLSAATDLYSVGVLAFELLHHGLPFPARSWAAAAEAHRSHPPPTLVPRVPVPLGVAGWVQALLHKRPGDRFPHAADALQALRGLGEAPAMLGTASPAGPSLARTLTATVPGEAVAIAELLAVEVAQVPATVPEALPPRPPRPQRRGGGGLLGLLAVPFVGRQTALEAVWACLIRGGHATLQGPRGVGRSRLGAEVAHRAAASGVAVLAVDGSQPHPLRQALARALGMVEGLPEPRMREAVALQVRRPVDDEAVAAVVSGLRQGDPGAGIKAWAGCQSRPVWLWADEVPDQGALASLVSRWAGARLVAPRHGVVVPGEVVRLEPLDDGALRALLADWVGLAPALVSDLAACCDGDVGLAVDLVRRGVEEGWLVVGANGWELAEAAALRVPDDAVAPWAARLPPLSTGERALMQEAAALGQAVDVVHLHDPQGARALGRRLAERGLASPTASGWRWPSAALREAVLRPADRAAVHRRLAVTYGDDERWRRGTHWLAGGDVLRGGADLVHEASNVIAEGRMVQAAHWLQRLWDALEGVVPTDHVLWGQVAQVRAVLGPTHQGYAETMAWSQRAVALSEPHWRHEEDWRRVRAKALGHLHWLANVQLMPTVAEPTMAAVAELLDRRNPAAVAQHDDHRGWTLLTLGRPREAMSAFAAAASSSSRHLRYVSNASLGVAMRHAGEPGAIDHLTVAGQAMLDAGFASARADLAFHLGDAQRHRGRLDEALSQYDEALRASSEGDARADVGFLVHRALCLRALGRDDEAQRALRSAQAQLDDDGPTWELVVALHLAVGDVPEKEAVEELVRGLQATHYVDPDVACSATALADLLQARGRPSQALRRFAEAQQAAYPYLTGR